MRTIVTATVLALTLTAASCASDGSSSGAGGYGGGSSATTSVPTPTASLTESGGGRYGYGNGGSGSGSGGAGPVAGSVVVADYSFTPSNVRVKSGATIKIQNTTPQTPHTFTVTGQPVDVSLDPGSTTKVTIDLPPGTYPFICRFHEGSGMKGTLIVE